MVQKIQSGRDKLHVHEQDCLERVRISWNSDEASYAACFLLLWQGSKWLNGRSV